MAIPIGETDQKLGHEPWDYKPDTQALKEFTGTYAAHYQDCLGSRTFSADTPDGVRSKAELYAIKHANAHRAGRVHGILEEDVPTEPCQPTLTDVFEVWTTTTPITSCRMDASQRKLIQ